MEFVVLFDNIWHRFLIYCHLQIWRNRFLDLGNMKDDEIMKIHKTLIIRILHTTYNISNRIRRVDLDFWRPVNFWRVNVAKFQQRTAMVFYEYPLQLITSKKIAKIQQKSWRLWRSWYQDDVNGRQGINYLVMWRRNLKENSISRGNV